MKIEINTNNTKKAQKLLVKFLDMNAKSKYDYFKKDSLFVGYNENSGFTYIYLESSPSISLCLDNDDNFCIVYSSGLDGLELIKYNIPNSLDKLETLVNNAYILEEDIRGNDYNNKETKASFIKKMISKNWVEL